MENDVNKKASHEMGYEERIKQASRRRVKEYQNRLKAGYIPEIRLKDSIIEKIYDSFTGSHSKPTYDDLLEFNNYLDSMQMDDSPQKPVIRFTDSQRSEDINKKPADKDRPDNAPQEEPEDGEDIFEYDFNKPLGKVFLHKDRTCTNAGHELIGMFDTQGRIRNPEGKQIAHLPDKVREDFNAFLESAGIESEPKGWAFSFHW